MGKLNSQFLIVANLFCNVYILSQRLIWINIYFITPAILRLTYEYQKRYQTNIDRTKNKKP